MKSKSSLQRPRIPKINLYHYFTLVLVLMGNYHGTAQHIANAKSPDGSLVLNLMIRDGKPQYQVQLDNVSFIETSTLGLWTSKGNFAESLAFVSSRAQRVEKHYIMENAKVREVDYLATELLAKFTNPNKDTLAIRFRLSDRDLAFSYEIDQIAGETNLHILGENTAFDLPDGTLTVITPQAPPMTGWEKTKPSYEEEYTLAEAVGTPSLYGEGYTFPALFKLPKRGWVLISETGVDGSYPGARLGEGSRSGLYPLWFPQAGENNGIGEVFASQALPARTPWRTITLGRDLKPIVETTVAYDLVEPKYKAAIPYTMGKAAWSWIVWQDESINYRDQLAYIDLADSLDFEYVLIDNWWDRSIGREKITELVNYAADRDVGVILWYNSNGYWNDAPQTPQDRMHDPIVRQKEMRWLQEIGVKGLKVDFFGGDKQDTMQLYEAILQDANNHGLAITFHGCTLPRGWEKMYPNFVTSEAVLASENLVFRQEAMDKHALNATLLPFTRNTVAAMDFAPVFLNQRLSKDQKTGTIRNTTDAFELATAALYMSPVQHFGLTPDNLGEQPSFVFDYLRELPKVWDETKYIAGEPMDYCALGRRKGEKWVVPVVNGRNAPKKVTLNLPMLAGKEVLLIHDKNDGKAGQKLMKVPASGKLTLKMLPQGGAVIISNR